MWLGEFDVSSLVDFKFTTRGTTGVPTTLAGTPAISVYKSNSTTESTTGVTLTVDFDARTGLNHVRVDTSADGTFYAPGTDFQVVITTGTVGGTSVVGEVIGHFTLRNRAGLKPATAGRTIVVDAAGLADCNVVKMGPTGAGVAQAARDIGTSVLLSAGTGAGQLDFTAGVVKANAVQWVSGAIPAVNVTGVPLVDAKYLLGTVFATPATAGIMDVNAKNINNIATTSVTVVSANLGTTQPFNFTGVGAAALAKSDMVDVAGVAVSATTAQLGVNVVNWNNTVVATPATAGIPDINVKNIANVAAALDANNLLKVDVEDWHAVAITTIVPNTASVIVTTNNDKTGYGITSNVKKNQALAKFQFQMTDSTNHNPAPGKVVTVTRSIDGGAFVAGTLANVTEVSDGDYTADFLAADLNGNFVVLKATAAGCDVTLERIVTQP